MIVEQTQPECIRRATGWNRLKRSTAFQKMTSAEPQPTLRDGLSSHQNCSPVIYGIPAGVLLKRLETGLLSD